MAKGNTAVKNTKAATTSKATKPASKQTKSPAKKVTVAKEAPASSNDQNNIGQLSGTDTKINPSNADQSGAGSTTNESGALDINLSGTNASGAGNDTNESGTSSETNSPNDQSNSPKTKITVVIPYLASAAQGDELKYALRGWDKNFEEDFDIVIIGDKPDFIADHVQHIPVLEIMPNPQSDMATKLMQVIASHLVSEDFILTNDDIYLVNPITFEELSVPRINGDLGEEKYRSGSAYSQRLHHTLEILRAFRLPTKDYAAHLPVVYNKSKLAETITKFSADTHGLLISNLYFNSNNSTEPILTKGNASGNHVVYVYRSNPNLDVVQHGFDHRKFVNHNNDGYLPTLPFLQKAFPDKSKFEK